MLTMPNIYPMEFRGSLVQMGRSAEPGVHLDKIFATDATELNSQASFFGR